MLVLSLIEQMANILDIDQKVIKDESIVENELFEYQPITGTQLNSAGQITITIENTDDYYHPHKSLLLIEGQLVKETGGGAYADGDLITLTNNALMYCFSNIKYTLAGMEIESLNHPGFATTMMGYCKYSTDFKKGSALNRCWYPDDGTTAHLTNNKGFGIRQAYIIKNPDPNGSFSFCVPLRHIFGFAEDYEWVMYGMRHTLTLVRTTDDNNALFRSAAAADGKIKFSKISWLMPKVMPNDEWKFKLYKDIESKKILDVAFRMRQCEVVEVPSVTDYDWRLGARTAPEKPRYIIIGLQTDKNDDQKKNAALFDSCKVTNMHVTMNNVRYPAQDVNSNFAQYKHALWYQMMTEFISKFYDLDELIAGNSITPNAFNELFPLFVFDLSRQNERLNQAIVDITVKMKFSGAPEAKTRAYALMISDRTVRLSSDGRKRNVLF